MGGRGLPVGAGGGRGGGGGHLHAVVVGALPVEVAAVVVDAAVVQRAEAHEAVLQRVVALLVHVVVPDHVLLTREPLPGEGGLAGAWPAAGQERLASCWPQAPPASLRVTLLGVEAAQGASRLAHGTSRGTIRLFPDLPSGSRQPCPGAERVDWTQPLRQGL